VSNTVRVSTHEGPSAPQSSMPYRYVHGRATCHVSVVRGGAVQQIALYLIMVRAVYRPYGITQYAFQSAWRPTYGCFYTILTAPVNSTHAN